jgi:hypothetical protein
MKLTLLVVCLALACLTQAEKTSYKDYKLLDLYVKTKKQASLIENLAGNHPDFDLWNGRMMTDEPVKVLLSPAAFAKYTPLFRFFQIKFDIVRDNYQEVIDAEEIALARSRANAKNIHGRFVRYTEIVSWIDDLSDANPNLVSSYIAGNSFEGRGLKVAVIKTATAQRKIWIDCGIHAREWISPATCVWVIDSLIKNYNSGVANIRDILAYYEFHIMPVQNPDGYEFSWTTTRLWRKNRRVNAGSTCFGTDLNRNFPFQWFTGGSSNNPCTDTYAGASAASEPETQATINAINRYRGQWDAALTIHTYGKWIFPPYGYSTVLPPDWTDQIDKARIISNAIAATYGQTGWLATNSAQTLGSTSGGTEDFTYATAGIKYSYCFELRPGQTGTDSTFGFQLPEDRAPLAGEETYRGILALINAIKP